jgi:hypothetical protein
LLQKFEPCRNTSSGSFWRAQPVDEPVLAETADDRAGLRLHAARVALEPLRLQRRRAALVHRVAERELAVLVDVEHELAAAERTLVVELDAAALQLAPDLRPALRAEAALELRALLLELEHAPARAPEAGDGHQLRLLARGIVAQPRHVPLPFADVHSPRKRKPPFSTASVACSGV